MRRLTFFLSCGVLVWALVGARASVQSAPPADAPTDQQVMDLGERSHVVSTEFSAAFVRVKHRAERVNGTLTSAAERLNSVTGG